MVPESHEAMPVELCHCSVLESNVVGTAADGPVPWVGAEEPCCAVMLVELWHGSVLASHGARLVVLCHGAMLQNLAVGPR